jgi:hypothetical protein
VSDASGSFAGTLDDGDLFGRGLAALGDLDGDGNVDLAAGAPLDDDGGSDLGATWLLFLDGNRCLVVFEDGFETGDLSAWGDAAPALASVPVAVPVPAVVGPEDAAEREIDTSTTEGSAAVLRHPSHTVSFGPQGAGFAPGRGPVRRASSGAVELQIGTQLRISDMGGSGDVNFAGLDAAVAYNSQNNEYLVVWYGDDNVGGLVEDECEIFGQRLDAATGAPLGTNDFRISHQGPDSDPGFDATFPAVAYNSEDNEYLVVWQGDDNVGGLVNGELEIYGQRLDAATGAPLGASDFRISDMGGTGSTSFNAVFAAVAYNSQDGEYRVVWAGDDNVGSLVDGEIEVFGQRLDAAGIALGANDFRISDMGPDGDAGFDASFPAVAYNRKGDEYLVVWNGDNDFLQANDEVEIFAQRLGYVGKNLVELGVNDLRISDMGPNGNTSYVGQLPAVTFNSRDDDISGRLDRRGQRRRPGRQRARDLRPASHRGGRADRVQRLPHQRHGRHRGPELRRPVSGRGLQRPGSRMPDRLGGGPQRRGPGRRRVRDLRRPHRAADLRGRLRARRHQRVEREDALIRRCIANLRRRSRAARPMRALTGPESGGRRLRARRLGRRCTERTATQRAAPAGLAWPAGREPAR